jgi:regulator of protease activity HflC (stomatin/prohibitin superfamily)
MRKVIMVSLLILVATFGIYMVISMLGYYGKFSWGGERSFENILRTLPEKGFYFIIPILLFLFFIFIGTKQHKG